MQSIPLSALQHYAFCPRQCAYIHIEQAWDDNYLTAKGTQLHERVHGGEAETRPGVRSERAVQVCSEKLGVHGVLDLLEVARADGAMTPVEYKKGKPKVDDCDRVQLCAQALCLEEMGGRRIARAALWYWQVRRREWVELDEALRATTREVIAAVRALFADAKLPPAVYSSACKSCSFFDRCRPRGRDNSREYFRQIFRDEETAE